MGKNIIRNGQLQRALKSGDKKGERYMTLGSTLYYEKKMSYDEGVQVGEEIGEERTKEHIAENLLELGVDPEIVKQAMETKSN